MKGTALSLGKAQLLAFILLWFVERLPGFCRPPATWTNRDLVLKALILQGGHS